MRALRTKKKFSHEHLASHKKGSYEKECEGHQVNHERMQQAFRDACTGTTRVNQQVSDFSRPIRLFLQPKGLIL